jgi:hypothetical protein
MSSASPTLSPTSMLPLPSAWLNFMSKSERRSLPTISSPARVLPQGSVSVPWINQHLRRDPIAVPNLAEAPRTVLEHPDDQRGRAIADPVEHDASRAITGIDVGL